MRLFLLSILIITAASCNRFAEVVYNSQQETITTLAYDEYKYVVDKKNRRGFVTSENEIMNGHYIVMRNGVIAEEFEITDGFQNGFHKQFDAEGNIEEEKTYKYSYLDGPAMTYYNTGEVQSKTTYKGGKLVGDAFVYDKAGNLISKKITEAGTVYEHHYKEGKLAGSKFEKAFDNEDYELIVKYDNFENIELIFGRKLADTSPVFYIFDSTFTLIEEVNVGDNPQRAYYYMNIFKDGPF